MKKHPIPLIFLLFIVGTLIALPVRTAEFFSAIDSSGFYVSGNSLVPFLNVFLVVFTVVLLASYLIRPVQRDFRWPRGSKVTGVLALLLGLALLAEMVLRFLAVLGFESAVSDSTYKSNSGCFLVGIGALLAALYFFLLAFHQFARRKTRLAVSSLFPVLWCVLLLIYSFMQYTAIANISKLLFDVLRMVFLLVFFYYNGRITGGVPNGREWRGAAAFGLPAALFGLLSSLPRLIAHGVDPTRGFIDDGYELFSVVLSLLLTAYVLDVLAGAYLSMRRHGPEEPEPLSAGWDEEQPDKPVFNIVYPDAPADAAPAGEPETPPAAPEDEKPEDGGGADPI